MSRLFAVLAFVLCISGVLRAVDDPAPTKAAQVMAEFGDYKVSAPLVWALEKSWLENLKAQKQNVQLSEAEHVQLRKKIINKELEMPMVEAYVKEKNLPIPEAEVKAKLDDFKKSRFGNDPQKFADFLKTIQKTEDEFTHYTSAVMALEKKLSAEVTDAEIQAFSENRAALRRVSHILFMYKGAANSTQERSKEEAKKLADAALEKLKQGKEFGQLAHEESDCPSKAQGGDLSFLPLKGTSFTLEVYKLEKVGDISGVVESEFGYHIFKLTDTKGNAADMKDKFRSVLARDRVQKLTQQIMEQRQSEIKYYEEVIKQSQP